MCSCGGDTWTYPYPAGPRLSAQALATESNRHSNSTAVTSLPPGAAATAGPACAVTQAAATTAPARRALGMREIAGMWGFLLAERRRTGGGRAWNRRGLQRP